MSISQHRELCRFPSDNFYGRSLKSADQINGAYDRFCHDYPKFKDFWPRPKTPTVFYDVKDGSESFVGSMEKARLESKCNTKEANKVVSIMCIMCVCLYHGRHHGIEHSISVVYTNSAICLVCMYLEKYYESVNQ